MNVVRTQSLEGREARQQRGPGIGGGRHRGLRRCFALVIDVSVGTKMPCDVVMHVAEAGKHSQPSGIVRRRAFAVLVHSRNPAALHDDLDEMEHMTTSI